MKWVNMRRLALSAGDAIARTVKAGGSMLLLMLQ
jgi:hypothetical protein